MSDDPEIVAEHGIPSAALQSFWKWCEGQEKRGNQGVYRASFAVVNVQTRAATFTQLKDIPKALRDGIVYYSRGHGWMIRKRPHWKGVFAERFPIHYARFTAGESAHE